MYDIRRLNNNEHLWELGELRRCRVGEGHRVTGVGKPVETESWRVEIWRN